MSADIERAGEVIGTGRSAVRMTVFTGSLPGFEVVTTPPEVLLDQAEALQTAIGRIAELETELGREVAVRTASQAAEEHIRAAAGELTDSLAQSADQVASLLGINSQLASDLEEARQAATAQATVGELGDKQPTSHVERAVVSPWHSSHSGRRFLLPRQPDDEPGAAAYEPPDDVVEVKVPPPALGADHQPLDKLVVKEKLGRDETRRRSRVSQGNILKEILSHDRLDKNGCLIVANEGDNVSSEIKESVMRKFNMTEDEWSSTYGALKNNGYITLHTYPSNKKKGRVIEVHLDKLQADIGDNVASSKMPSLLQDATFMAKLTSLTNPEAIRQTTPPDAIGSTSGEKATLPAAERAAPPALTPEQREAAEAEELERLIVEQVGEIVKEIILHPDFVHHDRLTGKNISKIIKRAVIERTDMTESDYDRAYSAAVNRFGYVGRAKKGKSTTAIWLSVRRVEHAIKNGDLGSLSGDVEVQENLAYKLAAIEDSKARAARSAGVGRAAVNGSEPGPSDVSAHSAPGKSDLAPISAPGTSQLNGASSGPQALAATQPRNPGNGNGGSNGATSQEGKSGSALSNDLGEELKELIRRNVNKTNKHIDIPGFGPFSKEEWAALEPKLRLALVVNHDDVRGITFRAKDGKTASEVLIDVMLRVSDINLPTEKAERNRELSAIISPLIQGRGGKKPILVFEADGEGRRLRFSETGQKELGALVLAIRREVLEDRVQTTKQKTGVKS